MSLKYYDKNVNDIILYTNILKSIKKFEEFYEELNNKKIDLFDLSKLSAFKIILVGYINLLKDDYNNKYTPILEDIIQSIDNVINHFLKEK